MSNAARTPSEAAPFADAVNGPVTRTLVSGHARATELANKAMNENIASLSKEQTQELIDAARARRDAERAEEKAERANAHRLHNEQIKQTALQARAQRQEAHLARNAQSKLNAAQARADRIDQHEQRNAESSIAAAYARADKAA